MKNMESGWISCSLEDEKYCLTLNMISLSMETRHSKFNFPMLLVSNIRIDRSLQEKFGTKQSCLLLKIVIQSATLLWYLFIKIIRSKSHLRNVVSIMVVAKTVRILNLPKSNKNSRKIIINKHNLLKMMVIMVTSWLGTAKVRSPQQLTTLKWWENQLATANRRWELICLNLSQKHRWQLCHNRSTLI